MAQGEWLTETDKSTYIGNKALAEWKAKMAITQAQLQRQMDEIAGDAKLKDAYRKGKEKKDKEALAAKQKAKGSGESLTENLTEQQVDTKNPQAGMQGGGSDLSSILPPAGEAPPFLMDSQRQVTVGPEQIGKSQIAPVRRETNRTNVSPNVLTAAQAQSGRLNRAKAIMQQRQFEQTEGRLASQHDTEENRLERKLAVEELKGNASAASSRASAALSLGRNRRELAKSELEDWNTHADALAKVGADPLNDKEQALYDAGLAKLPSDAHRDDVRKKTAALRSEYDRKAAGTGTVEVFNPDMPGGIQTMSGRAFLRYERLNPEGVAGIAPTSTRLTTDSEGNVTFEQGAATAAATRTMQGTLQEAVRTGVNALARVKGIEASYDPKFLEWKYQAKYKWVQAQIKAGRRNEISPEDIRFVDRYRNFVGSTMENLNLYIKEITGAQMSEAEAQRLMSAVANLDLDSVSFESDLRRTTRELRLQIARSSMLLSGGFGDENIQKVISEADKIKGTTTLSNGKTVLNSSLYLWNNVTPEMTVQAMINQERAHQQYYASSFPHWTEEQVNETARQKTQEEFGGVKLR